MNLPNRSPLKKMSSTRGRGKSPSWTAFDPKQRQKQALVRETENDPFPPLAVSLTALHLCTTQTSCNDLSARSFSSGLKPSCNFPTSKQENKKGSTIANFPGNANCDINLPSEKTADHVSRSSKWEKDDVYLSLRKDAISMMRSAYQHSRAATNAFLRGDHFTAQQYSQSAREERLAAQRLHAKAAREILCIKNRGNGLWKLDLHGLHAAEAVQALHEHLRLLKTQMSGRHSVSSNGVKANNGTVRSSYLGTISSTDKLGKQQTSSRQIPASLQVITGVGNHSRGRPVLPTVVRGFLIKNGEARSDYCSTQIPMW